MTKPIIKTVEMFGAFLEGNEQVYAIESSIEGTLQSFAEYQQEDGIYEVTVSLASWIDIRKLLCM